MVRYFGWVIRRPILLSDILAYNIIQPHAKPQV